MGNRNNNANAVNQGDQDQLLIQQDPRNINILLDQPEIKKVYAIKNPIFLKKETLKLERDFEDKDKYYISFNYDSLVDFDLYINFEVCRNKKNQKMSDYIPSYLPHKDFENLSLQIKHLEKGENVEFLNKSAFINLNQFNDLKLNTPLEPEYYDVSIEMIPLLNEDQLGSHTDNNTEIAVITLCNFITEENDAHTHKLKAELQRLKTQGLWIDLFDIFNCGLDSGECLICCNDLSNSIFLPCKHLCTCSTCAHSLRMRNNPCPICKNKIDDLLILDTEDKGKEKEAKLEDNIEVKNTDNISNQSQERLDDNSHNLLQNSDEIN